MHGVRTSIYLMSHSSTLEAKLLNPFINHRLLKTVYENGVHQWFIYVNLDAEPGILARASIVVCVSILSTLPTSSPICFRTFASYNSIGSSFSLIHTAINETLAVDGLKNGSPGFKENKPRAFLQNVTKVVLREKAN